jgi:choline-sulfatase
MRTTCTVVTAALTIVFHAAPLLAANERLNVLIIVSDDHRNDAYGAFGGQVARTPQLDHLAADGVRFERAYCNSPMCTPSRQSFLTGRYPHALGVTMLRHRLADFPHVTLAQRLHEAGYRTGAFGKMHFNSNERHGFEVHRTPHEFWATHARRPADRPLPKGVAIMPPWRPFKDPARIWLNGIYRPVGRYDDEMPATWYVRHAVEFMRAHKDEPFFVQVGFHQPHSPFQFPVEFRNRIDPEQLTPPLIGPEDVPQIPKEFLELTYGEKQRIRASYYTAVEYLDTKVGELLKALDDLGLADRTLVVYLGDHGYHLGEHGRFEKHCFYERVVRAPLVMRLPRAIPAAQASQALVEFVDIVPTVLDYLNVPAEADAPAPAGLHGHSLRPLIEGKVAAVRDAVFSEYQPTNEAMVRTDRWKLIYRSAHGVTNWMGYEPVLPPTQGRVVRLYDLEKDPEEFRNLAADPRYTKTVRDLLGRLADWYRRYPPYRPDAASPKAVLDDAIPPVNVPGHDTP